MVALAFHRPIRVASSHAGRDSVAYATGSIIYGDMIHSAGPAHMGAGVYARESIQ